MEQLDASQDSAPVEEAADSTPQADTSTSPDDPIESTTEEVTETSDDEEIDYDGEKYKVPKVLKDAFLRQQDYTVKTQSVAEARKQVELQQQELQQQAQAQQQYVAEYAEAFALDNQLKQFQQVNWQALIDSDPVQAMKLDRQMRELRDRRDQVVASVSDKQQQARAQMQRDSAKRIAEGQAVLAREIKGWSKEVRQELTEFGKQIGFTAEDMASVQDPKAVMILHKAWQFDQLMKKQATPKDKPAPQEKPPTRITASKGTATKDPSNMNDKEFAQMRRRQIAQR